MKGTRFINNFLTFKVMVQLSSESSKKGLPCRDTMWFWLSVAIRSWTETKQSPKNRWPTAPGDKLPSAQAFSASAEAVQRQLLEDLRDWQHSAASEAADSLASCPLPLWSRAGSSDSHNSTKSSNVFSRDMWLKRKCNQCRGSFYYVNYGSSIITSKGTQIISVMKTLTDSHNSTKSSNVFSRDMWLEKKI